MIGAPVWIGLTIVALFAVFAWMTAWSRADTWARPAAVALFIVSIPVVVLAGVETLGRHKPVSFAWLAAGDYHVLTAVLQQDKAIYVYLIDPARDEPRPLVLPWTNETAQEIQEAMDGAPEGAEGQFILNMNGTPDGEMTAHPIPQPATPPAKNTPDEGMVYQQE